MAFIPKTDLSPSFIFSTTYYIDPDIYQDDGCYLVLIVKILSPISILLTIILWILAFTRMTVAILLLYLKSYPLWKYC